MCREGDLGCGCRGGREVRNGVCGHSSLHRGFGLAPMSIEEEVKTLEELKGALERRLEALNRRLEALKR